MASSASSASAGQGADPDTDGHAQVFSSAVCALAMQLLHAASQILGQSQSALGRGIGQYHQEFFPTQPTDVILQAQACPQLVCQAPQRLISGQMTVLLID